MDKSSLEVRRSKKLSKAVIGVSLVVLLGALGYGAIIFSGARDQYIQLNARIDAGFGQMALLRAIQIDHLENREPIQEIPSVEALLVKVDAIRDKRVIESLQPVKKVVVAGKDLMPNIPMSINLTQVIDNLKLRYKGEVTSNTFDFKSSHFVSNPMDKFECETFNDSLVAVTGADPNGLEVPDPNVACVALNGTYRLAFKY